VKKETARPTAVRKRRGAPEAGPPNPTTQSKEEARRRTAKVMAMRRTRLGEQERRGDWSVSTLEPDSSSWMEGRGRTRSSRKGVS